MDIKDVENLAKLARIELGEDEKKEILKDMGSILGYVKQIEEVKIEDVEPEFKIYNVWREDTLESREFSKELITEQFPDKQPARNASGIADAGGAGFLKVKKIL